VGYGVLRSDEANWEERPFVEGQPPRLSADVTRAAGLSRSRARVWRYPPGTRGRRHADHAQEEVFVVFSGSFTFLVGDPPERVDAPPGTVVRMEIGTPFQIRNDGDGEATLFAYGAPPVEGGAEFLPDLG
jgi:mannose-6-phosphate isomerase-like protein (cupin superfamily)